MKTVEELYGAFGRDVVREVESALARAGDISEILRRLNLPHSPSLAPQHEALRAFLYQYGIALFLEIMRSNLSPEEVETAKSRLLLSRLVGDTRSRVPGKVVGGSAVLGSKPSPPTTALARGSRATPEPEPPAHKEPPVQLPPIVTVPGYAGPERRRNKDRRQLRYDRRWRVELIFKNHRFGGRDRRKTNRREEDRKKP